MTEKKRTWEDIPSLEGLAIDWDFIPKPPNGKRAYGRLTARELYPLFREKEFPVIVGMGNKGNEGNAGNKSFLIDVSEGGISIRSDAELPVDTNLTVTFALGNQEIVANGTVRMVREIGDIFFIGIQFSGLTKKNVAYIKLLYSSAKITR